MIIRLNKSMKKLCEKKGVNAKEELFKWDKDYDAKINDEFLLDVLYEVGTVVNIVGEDGKRYAINDTEYDVVED